MKYFVERNTAIDQLTNVDTLMKSAPDYYGPRFQAIADLRAIDDGTLHRGNEFRRVASLVNVPMLTVAKLLDPAFLSDKRRFYGWLKRNPSYQTYDKRGGSRPTVTFSGGTQVAG